MNHWPSRRGGEAISLPKRNAAAAFIKTTDGQRKDCRPYYQTFLLWVTLTTIL